jgi:hypothetical protein
MAILLGAKLDEIYSTLTAGNVPGVGELYTHTDGRVYMFVRYGTGGATANYAVSINAAGTAVMTSNSASFFGERVGVATATAVLNDYGWALIFGAIDVQTDVATVNTRMQTTTTAGQIDDAAGVGTKQINGLTLTTAKTGSAGLAPALLTWPTIGATN